jgi:hypothetical protein
MAYVTAIAPCFAHKGPFEFDPEKVTSVPIDPVTGLPPDLGGDATRAVAQPICPDCCKAINVKRRANGMVPLDERDSLAELKNQGGQW